MSLFTSTQSIGEIVSIMPKASEVFKKYGIDFCCGGHRLLTEAIKEQSLNETEVLNKLELAYEESKKFTQAGIDFRKMSPTDLIDYIVDKHHVYLKRALPEISDLATKILRAHGQTHGDVLFKVHKLYHNLKTELDQHLIKEEEMLFPMIKEYDIAPSKDLFDRIMMIMKGTESEHDAAGDILKELRKLTDQYKVPGDGCPTYFKAFDKLMELESDLFQHIHLENNILFKQIGINVNDLKM